MLVGNETTTRNYWIKDNKGVKHPLPRFRDRLALAKRDIKGAKTNDGNRP